MAAIAKVELKQRAVAREHPKPPRAKFTAPGGAGEGASDEHAAGLDAVSAELDKGGATAPADQSSFSTGSEVDAAGASAVASSRQQLGSRR